MAEGLEGVVQIREGVTAGGEGMDPVEVELVATCWRGKSLRFYSYPAL